MTQAKWPVVVSPSRDSALCNKLSAPKLRCRHLAADATSLHLRPPLGSSSEMGRKHDTVYVHCVQASGCKESIWRPFECARSSEKVANRHTCTSQCRISWRLCVTISSGLEARAQILPRLTSGRVCYSPSSSKWATCCCRSTRTRRISLALVHFLPLAFDFLRRALPLPVAIRSGHRCRSIGCVAADL